MFRGEMFAAAWSSACFHDFSQTGFITNLNPFMIWLTERTILDEGEAELTTGVWEDYKEWCKTANHRQLSQNRFYEQIEMNCPGVERKMNGPARRMHFVGLGLRVESNI